MKKTPRIRKDELAFGVETHVVEPLRGNSKEHLAWIRKQPCVVTGFGPCEPHHLTRVPGGKRGMGAKNLDIYTIPLTRHIHMALHKENKETEFLFDKAGMLDLIYQALSFATQSPDSEIRQYAKELLKQGKVVPR